MQKYGYHNFYNYFFKDKHSLLNGLKKTMNYSHHLTQQVN